MRKGNGLDLVSTRRVLVGIVIVPYSRWPLVSISLSSDSARRRLQELSRRLYLHRGHYFLFCTCTRTTVYILYIGIHIYNIYKHIYIYTFIQPYIYRGAQHSEIHSEAVLSVCSRARASRTTHSTRRKLIGKYLTWRNVIRNSGRLFARGLQSSWPRND